MLKGVTFKSITIGFLGVSLTLGGIEWGRHHPDPSVLPKPDTVYRAYDTLRIPVPPVYVEVPKIVHDTIKVSEKGDSVRTLSTKLDTTFKEGHLAAKVSIVDTIPPTSEWDVAWTPVPREIITTTYQTTFVETVKVREWIDKPEPWYKVGSPWLPFAVGVLLGVGAAK